MRIARKITLLASISRNFPKFAISPRKTILNFFSKSKIMVALNWFNLEYFLEIIAHLPRSKAKISSLNK